MIYACVVETSDSFYLLTDDDGYVLSGEKENLLNYWTKGWTRGLDRGAGWHTGACLSFIQFRPSVICVPDIDALAEIAGKQETYELSHITGMGSWFSGIKCNGPGVKDAWDSGEKPTFFYDD